MVVQLLLGMIGGVVVGAIALNLGWLADRKAAAAAAVVGGVIFGCAGWPGAMLLLAFFASASLLSRLPNPLEHRSINEKAPRRTARQVLANGGVAAVAAILVGLSGLESVNTIDPHWARMALAGALAAATADTWATEVGMWWGGTPRSALTGRRLQPGESGGVTAPGTLAGMMGAAWIGLVAYWVWPQFGTQQVAFVEVAGFLGMWVDSILGATVQYKAHCSICDQVVEEPGHEHPIGQKRGLRFVDNHVVNLVATFVGASATTFMM